MQESHFLVPQHQEELSVLTESHWKDSPLAQTSHASVRSVRSATGEDINNSLSKSEEPKVRKALMEEEKNG